MPFMSPTPAGAVLSSAERFEGPVVLRVKALEELEANCPIPLTARRSQTLTQPGGAGHEALGCWRNPMPGHGDS